MKPYSKEWEAACVAGKIANTLDCERTHKKLSSLTCLELAKKENDSLETEIEVLDEVIANYKFEAANWKSKYYNKVNKHLTLYGFFSLLAVALTAFTGGIWFTWTREGQPVKPPECRVSADQFGDYQTCFVSYHL